MIVEFVLCWYLTKFNIFFFSQSLNDFEYYSTFVEWITSTKSKIFRERIRTCFATRVSSYSDLWNCQNSLSDYKGIDYLYNIASLNVCKRYWRCYIVPYSPLKVNWCFRGIYHFHLQSCRISWARHQNESRWQAELLSSWYVAWLILWPLRWRRYVLKCWLNFSGLHSIISQKIVPS
jgi:hypothetical protein